MRVRVSYLALETLRAASLGVHFYSPDGTLHSQLTTRVTLGDMDLPRGPGTVEFTCPEVGL